VKSASPSRLLQAAVAASTAGVLALVGWYVMESREVGAHQQMATAYTQNSLALGQLLEEAVQYSRKDPSIIPLLNRLGGRPPGPAAQNPAPPANPTRR
jgi:hypothetical protein